jgi:arylsulfatase A-like enzyme
MPETDERPNVLWICTDQQRWDTLGCYGGPADTPTLDRLAAEGALFERAYCQNPVCGPSRGSFTTGRYPRTVGLRQNGQAIPDHEVPVTEHLARRGYTCGLAGKLHLSPLARADPERQPMGEDRIDDGYVDVQWSHSPGNDWPTNAYRTWLAGRGVEYDPEPFRGNDHVSVTVPREHHQTTWAATQAANFVRRAADTDEPWLYSVNVFDPHPGWDAPREYLEKYADRDLPELNYEEGELDEKPLFQRKHHDGTANRSGEFVEMDAEDHHLVRAAYYAMCDLIDDEVGRLLDALAETGQREETYVVFMSDHGEMLGDHGLYKKGPYFYEGAVRVPLVVDGPDVASVTHEGPVELVDVAPTLMDLAGHDVPEGMQGRSLSPVLRGESGDHREDAYCEFYNSNTRHQDPTAYATMLTDDRYKVVVPHGVEGPGELYDLRKDPAERHNRWDDPDYADTRREMVRRLMDRMAFTADPLPEREGPW